MSDFEFRLLPSGHESFPWRRYAVLLNGVPKGEVFEYRRTDNYEQRTRWMVQYHDGTLFGLHVDYETHEQAAEALREPTEPLSGSSQTSTNV